MPPRRHSLGPPADYVRAWPDATSLSAEGVEAVAVRAAAHLARQMQEGRRSRGWTRAELARRADLSPQTVTNLEDGASWADLITIAALAAALRLSVADLVT